jgi:hypothetical protein
MVTGGRAAPAGFCSQSLMSRPRTKSTAGRCHQPTICRERGLRLRVALDLRPKSPASGRSYPPAGEVRLPAGGGIAHFWHLRALGMAVARRHPGSSPAFGIEVMDHRQAARASSEVIAKTGYASRSARANVSALQLLPGGGLVAVVGHAAAFSVICMNRACRPCNRVGTSRWSVRRARWPTG